MSDSYDVIIIGAGPAGYVAAIRCAQLGMEVAVVESWTGKNNKPSLGGTCLNVGCIPSKALLDSAERYHHITQEVRRHGINVSGVTLDIAQMIARKDKVVERLTDGIAGLFKSNKIEWLRGVGKLLQERRVQVTDNKGKAAVYSAAHIIIASGSLPIDIPVAKVDGERIVDSSGALDFTRVPKKLAVIGGGIIGLELGSVWGRLGAEVVVLEALEQFLSIADRQIANEALKQFKSQGLDIRLSAQVTAAKASKTKVTVSYQDKQGAQKFDVERVLVAVGRKPNTKHITDDAGLKIDARGFIEVDALCRTNLPNVYAVGDCVRGPMLAHKGSEEGVAVAELIAGEHPLINYDLIPSVVYTEPEIAWVGKTEQQLKDAGAAYKAGVFPFAASGRALAVDATVGFVKVLADATTDRVLGVHIIGRHASELITEAVTVMAFEGASEDIVQTVHAHPTLSEAIHEAAMDADYRALHKVGKKRR